MVTFEYKGVVEMKGETKAFGQNGFTKRELVVGNPPDSPSMYPNPVLFTFKKDRCALLDPVNGHSSAGRTSRPASGRCPSSRCW